MYDCLLELIKRVLKKLYIFSYIVVKLYWNCMRSAASTDKTLDSINSFVKIKHIEFNPLNPVGNYTSNPS
jgi:hypothetical protein